MGLLEKTHLPAYDAGTEVNNELCEFIPGPPCGNIFCVRCVSIRHPDERSSGRSLTAL